MPAVEPPVDRSVDLAALTQHLGRLVAANAGIQEDVAGSVAALQGVVAERDLLQALIDAVPDILFVKDRQSRFLIANRAMAAGKTFLATGQAVTPRDLIGKTDFDLFPEPVAQGFRDIEARLLASGQPMIDMQESNVDAEGGTRWLSMSKVPLRNERGEVIGLAGHGHDVTARKQAEARVLFLAHHDPLTGLPNRALFADRLGLAIRQAQRARGKVTVVFLDLDKFKLVNDSLGHQAGDTLLKIAADRMSHCVRSSDTVARLGGDEFVILLHDPPKRIKTLTPLFERIRASIAEPVEIAGQQFTISTSMGVASFPEDGKDPEQLLAHADAAMYRAKELGRDNFQVYSASMTESTTERLSLVEALRQALAAEEFSLYYQPQIDLKTGRIFAVEALLRWQHPELGPIPPSKFIPLAEESGLILSIGKWVIETACAQNAQWQRQGLPPIVVSVNVSARQFGDKDLVREIKAALHKSGLAPEHLDLELTESMLMQDLPQAVATMHELEALGVGLSIDDFGTGYSSLSALKNFPIARLKIDQSFIKGLHDCEGDRAIAAAVISLGQKLKLRVIAEGVETDQQLAFLKENGCDEVQGFRFSRPVLPGRLAELLARQPGSWLPQPQ